MIWEYLEIFINREPHLRQRKKREFSEIQFFFFKTSYSVMEAFLKTLKSYLF
jgi:hypothetical protein